MSGRRGAFDVRSLRRWVRVAIALTIVLGPLAQAPRPASASTATFRSSIPIVIQDVSTAAPYPTVIDVPDFGSDTVTKVTVTLHSVSHTFPDDIDILLVSPSGVGVILMSDAGGTFDLADATLTFDDTASISLPDDAQIVSQAYKPTNYPPSDQFPGAPSGPYATQLSAFIGSPANGSWRLYIVDDGDGDVGSVFGWDLTFTLGTLPIAHDDSAATPNSTAVTIDVLANDTTDPALHKEPSTVTVTSGSSHGSTSVNTTTGQITYTPAAGYSGPDSFTYTFKDSTGLTSNAATVRISVGALATVVTTPTTTATEVPTAVPTTITTPTLTPTLSPPTPAATATAPPPAVVSVRQAGTNRLQVEITVTGALQRIEWAAPPNASIEDAAGTSIGGGTLILPANTTRATLYMRRLSGTSATVPLTLIGSFGVWHTFVGGGPDAW